MVDVSHNILKHCT